MLSIVSKWSPSPPMQCKLHYNISRRKHIIAFFSWNAAKISSSRQLFYTHTHTHVLFTSSTGRDGARTAAAAGLPAPCGLRLLEPRPGHSGHLCQAGNQVSRLYIQRGPGDKREEISLTHLYIIFKRSSPILPLTISIFRTLTSTRPPTWNVRKDH